MAIKNIVFPEHTKAVVTIDDVWDFQIDLCDMISKIPTTKKKDAERLEIKIAKLFDDFADDFGFDMLEQSLEYGKEPYPKTWLDKGWELCEEEIVENITYLDHMEEDEEDYEWWVEFITGIYYDAIEMVERYAGTAKEKKTKEFNPVFRDVTAEREAKNDEIKLLKDYKKKHPDDIVLNEKDYNAFDDMLNDLVDTITEMCKKNMNENENTTVEIEEAKKSGEFFMDVKRKWAKDKSAEDILNEVYRVFEVSKKLSEVLIKFGDVTYNDVSEILEAIIDDLTDYAIIVNERK